MKTIAITILLLLGVTGCAGAGGLHPPACNENPCRVIDNTGGYVAEFRELAERIVRTHEKLVIGGKCYSSCTLLADRARPQVCIEKGTTMFIHQQTNNSDEFNGLRTPIPYSSDIEAWIIRHGGQPTVGFLSMPYSAASRFWPTCG